MLAISAESVESRCVNDYVCANKVDFISIQGGMV